MMHKDNPISQAIADIIKDPIEHLLPIGFGITMLAAVIAYPITQIISLFRPQDQFGYAAQDATNKYIKTSGECQVVHFDPKRNYIVVPQSCNLDRLDHP